MEANAIIAVFNQTFLTTYNTQLIGGADEPLYRPADELHSHHTVYFRSDYASSALHEIAHWCIAGAQRRLQEDYGYWYAPDGRTQAQQALFEQVEVKPQALEAIFSDVCGVRFRCSADNLNSDFDALTAMSAFEAAVAAQVSLYQAEGLPPRAQQFVDALSRASCLTAEVSSSQR